MGQLTLPGSGDNAGDYGFDVKGCFLGHQDILPVKCAGSLCRCQMHLAAFMRPASIHTGAWRYPGAWPDANFNLPRMRYLIRRLEAACFDAYFMADHLAVLNMPVDALKRSHTVTSFEPFTLLSALSQATERIGLIATGSTTFDTPFHIARRFA